MADEPTPSGWLPPRAPGAGPVPRFEPAPPEPEPERPEPAALAASSGPRLEPAAPAFVRGKARPSDRTVVTALVLGVVGLALLLVSAGTLFLLTVPCSIAAWVLAAQVRRRLAAGQAAGSAGQAKTAFVLGVLGVVLGLIAAVAWTVAIASGLDLEELRRDLERQSQPDAVDALLRLFGLY